MNQTSVTIRDAEELHKYLIAKKNFDFNPDHDRDAALYRELKLSLDLPAGAFLTALRERNVSAEQYLRALMAAAEPLAEMYQEILEYCERANFLRSKGGAKMQWDITSANERIGFSPEAFRLFDEIKASVEPSRNLMLETKNEIMDWLAHDVFAPNHTALPRKDLDWRSVDIFRILSSARDRYGQDYEGIFRGLNNYYLDGTGGRPSTQLKNRVTKHQDYLGKLSAVAKAFNPVAIELVASKFIELPFWKFRWQVYEIWVIVVSLSEFEQFGFQLVANPGGGSLIELGSPATLAMHADNPCVFDYQPTYRNRNNAEIRPDIVVSSFTGETHDDVLLIVECKQRISLDVAHVEQVQEKYEGGVNASLGEVVIVNYDDAPAWSKPVLSKTKLIGNMRPKSAGEKEFRRFLRNSQISRSMLRETWFIDVSLSMSETLDEEFRRLLAERSQYLKPDFFKLYGFARQVEERQPSDVYGDVAMSDLPDETNWEGHGIDLLCTKLRECLRVKSLRLIIVSDIVAKIKHQLFPVGSEFDRVHFVDPTQERDLVDMISKYKRDFNEVNTLDL